LVVLVGKSHDNVDVKCDVVGPAIESHDVQLRRCGISSKALDSLVGPQNKLWLLRIPFDNLQKYTFAALLNLIDFATDEELRFKAHVFADRLVSEWLLITTSAGYFYPVAGRNFDMKYLRPDWATIQWMALAIGIPFVNQTYGLVTLGRLPGDQYV
jgi:hypothetical protein